MPGWQNRLKTPFTPRADGFKFERVAEKFLRKKGLQLVVRNYSCRGGEIDLIMREQDILVFVEVRYRKSDHYGSAAESITFNKQRKIIHCAQVYLQANPACQANPLRFDVVAIRGESDQLSGLAIDWHQNAFC